MICSSYWRAYPLFNNIFIIYFSTSYSSISLSHIFSESSSLISQGFLCLSFKNHPLFCKNVWQIIQILQRNQLIIFYFNRLKAIFCYLVIPTAMSSIRILLYPISWSFILSSLRSLKAPWIISCSSGILIFPRPIPSYKNVFCLCP